MPESTATISVESADQVYNQTNEFIYFGGDVNHNADLSIEVNRRIRNAWCSFRKYTLELYDRPSAPLELKLRMLRVEVLETGLYGCVTWSPRACHYDTLRRVHHRFLTRYIGWRKTNPADHPISHLDTLIKTGSESIEATLRELIFSFFCVIGDVAFFDYVCTITLLSLYGEYAVRFPLPDVVFSPWDHGLFFVLYQHNM